MTGSENEPLDFLGYSPLLKFNSLIIQSEVNDCNLKKTMNQAITKLRLTIKLSGC